MATRNYKLKHVGYQSIHTGILYGIDSTAEMTAQAIKELRVKKVFIKVAKPKASMKRVYP